MSVPMSQYEALLEEVRCLRRKAQHVQQLAAPLLSSTSTAPIPNASTNYQVHQASLDDVILRPFTLTMEPLVLEIQHKTTGNEHLETNSAEGDTTCSEDECGRVPSTHNMSVSSEPISQKTRGMAALYHGTWPVERTTMWNSEPTNLGPVNSNFTQRMDQASVMSFASSSGGAPLDRVLSSPDHSRRSSQQLEAKMDMVYSLLAMLGGQEHADMGETLLALSTSPESCLAMRQSGCIPLLVQLVQSDKDGETRTKASQALHNLVYSQPDEKLRKRETRVLKLLEHMRLYTEAVKNNTDYEPEAPSTSEDGDKHPVLTVAHVMKLSFDEGHRQAICQLGGINTIASMVETEHTIHGSTSEDTQCVLMRRYACMALTNLTFGDSGNKALLCSFKQFMHALVVQLQSPSDELRQVTASVLRNLSWRADPVSKEILREVMAVTGLMKAAMVDSKENTLKSILSALWNLSAHCTENKAEICAIDGALGFLVNMLSYKTPSKSLAVIENSGGILRNISSQIAVRDDYREILRKHNCLQVLLEQLKSPSLTIVSNACGTLWNLSAKNAQDQEALWQMGAPAMLRSLNHSKHKMIAMGSSAALKNLLSSRPSHTLLPQMDSTARAMDLPVLPTLDARKQKALLQDLDQNLLETFDNIDSPTKTSTDDKLFDRTEKYIPTNELLLKTHKTKHTVKSDGELIFESNEHLPHREIHLLDKECSPWKYEKEELAREEYLARKSDERLCQTFTSLSLNEPCTSYQKDYPSQSRLIQNIGSASLPYANVNAKRSGTYIPMRNKYSDCGFEDDNDIADQPIDFSRKYAEIKNNSAEANQSFSQGDKSKTYYSKTPKVANQNDGYGIYAETDLDQPTDYSLRYAEDDSDSDMCDKISKNEFVQDTVKTYCTEGTPYETPFNFSTATSMSDLRIDTSGDAEKVIDNDKLTTIMNKSETKNPTLSHLDDEKDHCSVEDISEIESRPKNSDKALKFEFSSGLMSPEKPVNYCEEGTPGCFSRVSSFGSLSSLPVNESQKVKENVKENEGNGTLTKVDTSPSEATKAVKFEQTVNYAEETPLMFSRSSSLASLDSVEQHSIHDDRSSVISDFSRLTSGLVSPSELPDSPTQTVPPSPKPRKGPLEYPSTSRGQPTLFTKVAPDGRPQPAPRTIQKPSVFEDNVTKFKEESTPVQFSTATSLSSLTIDDHDDQIKVSPSVSQQSESTISPMASIGETSVKQEDGNEKQDDQKEKQTTAELNEDFLHISEDEGDDAILADCINIGMQNNRHRQSKDVPLTTANTTTPSFTNKYTSSQKPHARNFGSGIPLPKSAIPTRSNSSGSRVVALDSVKTYCTEDTPAALSHAGSNSDLSNLSMPNDSVARKGYFSDESSNLSGENDNILAECIQSAMPKAKKISVKPTTSRQIPMLSKNVALSAPIKPFNREVQIKNETKAKSLPKEDVKKNKVPLYFTPKENTEKFAVENSPCQFSLRSSLSDLTVDGSVAGLVKTAMPQQATTEAASTSVPHQISPNKHQNNENNLSRQDSLSSLSVESLGSLETEQALLEQCISSGMPKSKTEIPQRVTVEKEKPIGVATKQFITSTKIKYEERRFIGIKKPETTVLKVEPKDKKAPSNSKNVYAASAVENIIRTENKECPEIIAMTAGVDPVEDSDSGQSLNPVTVTGTSAQADTSQDKSSPIKENSSIDLKKNGYDVKTENSEEMKKQLHEDNCMNKCDASYSSSSKCDESVEELGNIDNRMLDPDAMIESLDRFTAELVSQAASHLQNKEESKFQASVTEAGDTWNEDTSPNDVTFPSISGSTPNVITFESDSNEAKEETNDLNDELDGLNNCEQKSNDFSSLNSSTLTESTLIAMEATKIATTFKTDAMSESGGSLELDLVQPPSQLNSLTNSTFGGVGGILSNSTHEMEPKVKKQASRKKSLPVGLMVRRALSNSVNQASSLESLSNLDHMNPPSAMVEALDLLDLEGSMTSVASLQSEVADVRGDFIPSSSKELVNPIFNVKQPLSHIVVSNSHFSCIELEHINPPSIFNEITDLCNSLADAPTEGICSETEVFEDCCTLLETNAQTDDFSDANSATPLQSDPSSSTESTPRRAKNLQKALTPKQRRNLAKERYKTYTVAAEMLMGEETMLNGSNPPEENVQVSSSKAEQSPVAKRMTPKERRQNDPSRFQTQVLEESMFAMKNFESPPTSSEVVPESSLSGSPSSSPAKTKLSTRRNFLQKRLENRDRFRTKTLSESSLSPELLNGSPTNLNINSPELHLMLQKEADVVLKTLNEAKSRPDELLDCETLSLVSNEDDSEHNSGSSINYRTYHKSWGFSDNNIPVVQSSKTDLENYNNGNLNSDRLRTYSDENVLEQVSSDKSTNQVSSDEDSEIGTKVIGKPKIVKPSDRRNIEESATVENDETQGKGVRGRRKPLYVKTSHAPPKSSSIKPIRNMPSNLVKNVTSTLKNGTALKPPAKSLTTKPPVPQPTTTKTIKQPSNYKTSAKAPSSSKQVSPVRSQTSNKKETQKTKPVLERQETFTKEDSTTPKSKIPTNSAPISSIPKPSSRIARAVTQSNGIVAKTVNKIQSAVASNRQGTGRNGIIKSASTDRANKLQTSPNRMYGRSPSADARDVVKRSSLQSSSSNQNLRSGAVKRSSAPEYAHRSSSNSSITSTGSGKQITSRIAGLWKKVEEGKRKSQPKVTCTQSEAQSPESPRLIRSNTFDNKDAVILQNITQTAESSKRISRLGSFVFVDETEATEHIQYETKIINRPSEVTF